MNISRCGHVLFAFSAAVGSSECIALNGKMMSTCSIGNHAKRIVYNLILDIVPIFEQEVPTKTTIKFQSCGWFVGRDLNPKPPDT